MKLNLQKFGGRGASSTLKSKTSAKQPQTIEEKFPIPNNVSNKQKEALEKIRRIALSVNHGEKHVDDYEIKQFDISVNENIGSVSVFVATGLKNDEGTMASILARDKALIFIGKNGGMRHMSNGSTNLKRTKYLSQAFYDYTYGKGRRK